MATTEKLNLDELYAQEKINISTPRNSLPTEPISDQYKGLKVLGLVADSSACGYYRVINPLHLLKLHGADITYSSFHNYNAFLSHDVIIAPRQHSPDVYEALRQVAFEGKLIIYEIDDDLDSVLPSSPAYQVYHPGSQELAMLPKFMHYCHGLTTTTPEIGRWYYRNQRNVVLIDNFIDPYFRNWAMKVTYTNGVPNVELLEPNRPDSWKDKIVIMYSGGSTHGEDMQQIGPAMKRILEKYPQVQFALNLGLTFVEQLITKYDLPQSQISYVPARHFLDHPEALHGIDIGLAPLVPCQFNLAKCVVGDTKIYTPKGIFNIEDLCSNREIDKFTPLEIPVFTQNGVQKTSHFFYGGKQKTLKFKTNRGFETEVSLTHRLKDGDDAWKVSRDFKVGDKILLASYEHPDNIPYKKVPYFWTCTRKDSKVSDKSQATNLPLITIDEIWGEFLGFVLSDGNITKTGGISVCVCGEDKDVLNRVEDLYRKLGLEPTTKKAPNRNMYYVYAHSKPFAEFLFELGFVQNKKLAKDTLSVPKVILESRKSVIASFLSAMFEGDGYVSKDSALVEISSCSSKLMRDIHQLLLGFGIVAKLNDLIVKYQNGTTTATKITLARDACDHFHKKIKFVGKRKQDILSERVSRGHSNAFRPMEFVDTIIEITEGEQEVFDITVPTGEHWLGAGFVQHNSPLKFKEYSAVGAVPIGSNVGPYARYHRKHPEGNLLVGNNGSDSFISWEAAISYLIERPELLAEWKKLNRQIIVDNYLLDKNIYRWPAAWASIAEKVKAGEVGRPDVQHPKEWYKTFGRAKPNDPCPCESGKKLKKCCGGAW